MSAPPRPGPRAILALLPPLVLACLACGRSAGTGEPFFTRLLKRAPDARFRLGEVVAVEPAAEIGTSGCLAERGWEVSLPLSAYRCVGPALVLEPSERRVILTRELAFDAAEVDAFQVRVSGATRQPVSIEWARAGEQFGGRRRMERTVEVVAESGEGRVRLPVAGHPDWQGEIARLRLLLNVRRTVRLSSFAAVRESLDPRRLEEASSRPWQIDVDNETRPGVLGVPGRPRRWQTAVEPGAELRFAYGRHGDCGGAIHFRVRALAGDDWETLFAEELPCHRTGWQEAKVPLGDRAGPLVFEFATEVDGRLQASSGIPVWAGVELVGGRPPGGLNLVLISIDTLRPDHLSLYGYTRPTSPRLDRRCARGAVVFERAVAAAPWTLPSHASIFTGLDALRHGVNQSLGMPPSLLTLAEILHAHGYATRAVTGGGFVHQQYGFAQGFDAYSSFSERMGFADELDAGVASAKAQLGALRDRRFFFFFHTYAVHNPFLPRQPYLRRLTGRTTASMVNVEHLPAVAADGFRTRRALYQTDGGRRVDADAAVVHELGADLYDSGIAYADERLDELLAELDDLGLADRTLIVITSDHGELFGEHGLVNHFSLYDENVMVPLVFLDPALGPGVRRVRSQVRSIDLLPTILDRLGLPSPAGIDGRSFAPLLLGAGEARRRGTGDAWSYASASNFGIALRRPDGATYVARNDAWVAPGPREELLGAAHPGGDGELAALRASAESRLRQELAGLRIRCRNPGPAAYTLSVLEGPSISSRMKLGRIGDGVLAIDDDGRATLTVAPGDDLLLIVEGSRLATLHLVVTHPQFGVNAVNVDPLTLETKRWGGWSEGGWRVGEIEPPDGGALSFWWQGKGAPVGPVEEAPDDADLRRRLRALGYLQ